MPYKSIAIFLAVVPTLVLAAILNFSPDLIIGNSTFDASLKLSLFGTLLSYYGVVFSLYAALQVQAISDVYFFKARSPGLQKKLSQISKTVGEFGNEPSVGLRSQTFISEASVAFRSAKRIKNKQVKSIAAQAEVTLARLKESMKSSCGVGVAAGQVPNFWEFHQKVAELVDELGEQIKDARAQS